MTLYLGNARYIDWESRLITHANLKVEPGPTGGIEFVDAPFPTGAEVIDCQGMLVTHAFANGHHHIYSTLARGMPSPARSPRSFIEILELIWWNLDKALDEPMIRASARAAAVEAARCGCTFIIDHHASPNAAAGSLHIIAEALEEVGLSHLLSYELSDRDGADARQAGLEETRAYLAGHSGLVGVHASFTVSDGLLDSAMQLAVDCETGLHIHVAEAESDEAHCLEHHDCRVMARLDRVGALKREQTILAHCLHVDDAERALFADSEAWIVHNTQSNQNNNVGAFDPRGLGRRIFIGTDGMHNDMLGSARAAYLEGQAHGGLSPEDAYRRLRQVHRYLKCNSIDGDGENNLVLLDYKPPTPITSENWPAHVVYGVRSDHVHSVISNGRLIVADSRMVTVDDDAILAEAQVQAERLWRKL